jgi:hypothetical protein
MLIFVVNCVIRWIGPSVGEELWGREQTWAREENSIGQEARVAA